MQRLEGPAILLAGLAGLQNGSEDRLPGVRPGVLQGLLGTSPFEPGEQVREGDRNDRPFGVFLVPAVLFPEPGVDAGIAGAREMETAMSGCRMADDALGKDRRALRGSPRRIGAGAAMSHKPEHGRTGPCGGSIRCRWLQRSIPPWPGGDDGGCREQSVVSGAGRKGCERRRRSR